MQTHHNALLRNVQKGIDKTVAVHTNKFAFRTNSWYYLFLYALKVIFSYENLLLEAYYVRDAPLYCIPIIMTISIY